ncbi:MAG: FKBP-type peptidyl-prolyl cis-trans isomerase [Candidatus Altarchaeum sp.]|nr:FKBP-type peptidyl-prolyl cis-trans isomerase [Candidatus Altarchaeum sp.]
MNGKNLLKGYELLGIAAVGAILIFSMLISGCVDSGGKFVKEGDNVKVNITENNITKTIFIENISDQGKNYPFEKDLIGTKVGEKKNISYEEIVSVKLSQEPKANTVYSTPQGAIKIFNVTDTQFYVGQHLLTGETLKFHVTIKNISDQKALNVTIKNISDQKALIVKSTVECLAKYNISPDNIVFYYSDGCGYCTKMKPLVKELENDTNNTYKFLWINMADVEKMKIGQECLANIFNFGKGYPQFACPSNAQWNLGAFGSKDEMKNFADACKKSAAELSNKNKTVKTTVENGVFIEVEYVGKLTNGTVFDSGTINFTVGSGQMIKGFDKGVVGMKIGESKDMIIPPEEAYGLPGAIPRVIPQEITINLFKRVFNNEEPIKGKEYTNLNSLPWPVKIIDVKTIYHNITIEILDTGNFSYSCLKEYGIDKGTVIFYHTDWCPHCQKMKPWVQNLTDKGYKFFSVEAEKEPDKVEIVVKCASNEINMGGGIPQFGCVANGKSHSGEFMSIEDMKNFAEECNKAA